MKAAVILASLLVSFTAVPARAVMQPVGSVDLSPVTTVTGIAYTGLRGDLLALTARGNADIGCHTVIATFADGSTAEIFHGLLPPDNLFKVYLPGGVRDVRRIDFSCLSIDRGRAIITVQANVAPDSRVTWLSEPSTRG